MDMRDGNTHPATDTTTRQMAPWGTGRASAAAALTQLCELLSPCWGVPRLLQIQKRIFPNGGIGYTYQQPTGAPPPPLPSVDWSLWGRGLPSPASGLDESPVSRGRGWGAGLAGCSNGAAAAGGARVGAAGAVPPLCPRAAQHNTARPGLPPLQSARGAGKAPFPAGQAALLPPAPPPPLRDRQWTSRVLGKRGPATLRSSALAWLSAQCQQNTLQDPQQRRQPGCSRAEDLSTADQAEGEAGRPGAEMQPEHQLSQDLGASHQLRKGAWSRCLAAVPSLQGLLLFLDSHTVLPSLLAWKEAPELLMWLSRGAIPLPAT
ncbi:collagen, type I, alpha 1b-like [Zonotrichia leucophrys gambelii]|uniref:collagen, type I, alpha 1b-like n=1 Tax=Zonotrichia leucophrys gambelii TaxID=257770 RepID=UPI0031403215